MISISTPRTLRAAFIEEPIRLAISQPHQTAISTVSVTLTARFFAAGGVVPLWVAVIAAVGVEYAFLKGLADAAFAAGYAGARRSAWGSWLIGSTFGLLVIAGVYVLLSDVYHLAVLKNPPDWGAVLLALAHILPLALIGLCSAQLHAESETLHHASQRKAAEELDQLRREEAERRRQYLQEEEARRQRLQAEQDRIALLRAERLAEVEAMEAATLARRRLRESAADRATRTVSAPSTRQASTASGRDFDARVTALVDAVKADASLAANKAEWARRIGLSSRTAIYPVIKAAQERGLLDADGRIVGEEVPDP